VRQTTHNKGTPGNPMTDDELSAKFVDLASTVLGEGAATSLLDELWRVGELADIRPLVRRCAAGDEATP
jgi:hypothetical protein